MSPQRTLAALLVAVLLKASLVSVLLELDPLTARRVSTLQLERPAVMSTVVPPNVRGATSHQTRWSIGPASMTRLRSAGYRLVAWNPALNSREHFASLRSPQARAPPRLGCS